MSEEDVERGPRDSLVEHPEREPPDRRAGDTAENSKQQGEIPEAAFHGCERPAGNKKPGPFGGWRRPRRRPRREFMSLESDIQAMETESALHRLASRGGGDVLSAVSDRQRRMTLLLVHRDGVKRESDLLIRESGSDEVEQDLVANHLPALEEAGFIEWDRETGTISKGPRFDEIEPVLELIENHPDELPPDWP